MHSIDGRGYPAYREMKGEYDFGEYTLSVDHVQADPFAPPRFGLLWGEGKRVFLPSCWILR